MHGMCNKDSGDLIWKALNDLCGTDFGGSMPADPNERQTAEHWAPLSYASNYYAGWTIGTNSGPPWTNFRRSNRGYIASNNSPSNFWIATESDGYPDPGRTGTGWNDFHYGYWYLTIGYHHGPSDGPWWWAGRRHGESSNWVFLDGHVESTSMPYGELTDAPDGAYVEAWYENNTDIRQYPEGGTKGTTSNPMAGTY